MLCQFVLFGFEQADSVGGDAVHEEDADVETWGVAVKADFATSVPSLYGGGRLAGQGVSRSRTFRIDAGRMS